MGPRRASVRAAESEREGSDALGAQQVGARAIALAHLRCELLDELVGFLDRQRGGVRGRRHLARRHPIEAAAHLVGQPRRGPLAGCLELCAREREGVGVMRVSSAQRHRAG